MIYRYSLYSVVFHFLYHAHGFNFDEAHVIFLLLLMLLVSASEESLPNPRSKMVLPLFFLEVQLTFY